MPPKAKPIEETFWPRVNQSGECWLWTAYVDRGTGYGKVWDGRRVEWAHRVAYRLKIGPIPTDGTLVVDHLCHTSECKLAKLCMHRRCVRPSHLTLTTKVANILRGDRSHNGQWQRDRTHCPRNHEYDKQNTWIASNGARHCKTCNRENMRAQRAARSLLTGDTSESIA